jgi:hypothetical protein
MARVEQQPSDPYLVRTLVYMTVAVGSLLAVIAVLLATDSFDGVTPLLALWVTVPYLVFTRLALLQPGAEAITAGVLLVGVGSWGYLSLLDGDRADMALLAAQLILVECLVFAGGKLLRGVGRR